VAKRGYETWRILHARVVHQSGVKAADGEDGRSGAGPDIDGGEVIGDGLHASAADGEPSV
jgi:hypothetical protein